MATQLHSDRDPHLLLSPSMFIGPFCSSCYTARPSLVQLTCFYQHPSCCACNLIVLGEIPLNIIVNGYWCVDVRTDSIWNIHRHRALLCMFHYNDIWVVNHKYRSISANNSTVVYKKKLSSSKIIFELCSCKKSCPSVVLLRLGTNKTRSSLLHCYKFSLFRYNI